MFGQTEKIPEKYLQKGFIKSDFLSVKMPELEIPNEPNMGFTGIHYNLFLTKNIYSGLGIYGSVTGKRGGFFTLGLNAGLKKYLSEKMYVDAGFHFGGGGGAGAADGGGAFILPHINIGVDFTYFSLQAGWSSINFFDGGRIKGNQFNVAIEIPFNYNYTQHSFSETSFNTNDLVKTNWNKKAKKTGLMVHFNNLKVQKATPNLDGEITGKTIRLAGFEFSNYMNKSWFTFIKVDGAYSGIRGGYMDVFLGGGYHFSFNKNNTNIISKFAVGAGGGGGVDSDGGLMINPDISIEQRVYKGTYLSLNKGYLGTPSSVFATSTLGVGLKYYIERNGIFSADKKLSNGTFKGVGVIVKQDWYLNAKRMENPTEDMHQISLQVNFDLTNKFFVSGQTSFANFGNAGAYGEGLVGFGLKSKKILNNKALFFTQVLAGASGGGNISSGEGLIIKPSIGGNYKINNLLDLRASVGYVKAKGGNLSNSFINLGIQYNFSFLNMK